MDNATHLGLDVHKDTIGRRSAARRDRTRRTHDRKHSRGSAGPAIGINLRRRSENQPPEVLTYAWAAQCRLYSRFHSIATTKNRNVAVVAVARELSGFIWGLMTDHAEVA